MLRSNSQLWEINKMIAILTPSLNPPFILLEISPAYGARDFAGWAVDEVLDRATHRNAEVGLIPSGA